MKLRKLRKNLNRNSKDQTPSTAQQTITFKKMYPDGTCKVNRNYYTRMVRFDDLNYCLQDVPMHAEILGMYSQFINYFEPGIHFQIFLQATATRTIARTNRMASSFFMVSLLLLFCHSLFSSNNMGIL